MTGTYKHMYTSLEHRANALEAIINNQAQYLAEAHNLIDISPVGLPVQSKVTAIGRVCCDAIGKLNDKSVILEGSRNTSDGARTRLDLSNPNAFTLFPGQIIAVDGIDATGRKMMAKSVYSGAPFKMATTRVSEMKGYSDSLEDSSLVIWSAAGIFYFNFNGKKLKYY